jgi:uncharacterized protein YdhG (YjbR/CyaY superfamily)
MAVEGLSSRHQAHEVVAKTGFKSVDEYIASQPRAAERVLKRVRTAIRKAVPGAEETISYQIPTYKVQGRYVLYFAGWKAHYSLYPANDRLTAKFSKQLEPYEVNDKGTIRFPLSEPVPVKLIEAIAKFRAKDVMANGKARAATKKKR